MVTVRFLGPDDFKVWRVSAPDPGAGEYVFEKGRTTECPDSLAQFLVGIMYEGRPPDLVPEPMYEIVGGGED